MTPEGPRPARKTRRGATSTIRAFFFWPLIKELNSSGVDTAELLESLGISNFDIRTPYAALPLAQFVALAERMSTTLKRPYLGLEIGQKFTLADLGPFYALFTLAADLKAALANLARYKNLADAYDPRYRSRPRNEYLQLLHCGSEHLAAAAGCGICIGKLLHDHSSPHEGSLDTAARSVRTFPWKSGTAPEAVFSRARCRQRAGQYPHDPQPRHG